MPSADKLYSNQTVSDCMDIPCLICEKKFKDHSKKEADDCSQRTYIYYRGLEILSK